MFISMFVEQRGIEPRSIRFPMYGFNECRNLSCPFWVGVPTRTLLKDQLILASQYKGRGPLMCALNPYVRTSRNHQCPLIRGYVPFTQPQG